MAVSPSVSFCLSSPSLDGPPISTCTTPAYRPPPAPCSPGGGEVQLRHFRRLPDLVRWCRLYPHQLGRHRSGCRTDAGRHLGACRGFPDFPVCSQSPGPDRPLDAADYRMEGVFGTVSSPVLAGATGEMIFVQQGRRTASSIRSETGTPIETGREVVVTRYENGIAYVREWDELTA